MDKQRPATRYQPRPGDFEPLARQSAAPTLSRPSLSYWQDAWRQLKRNRGALISLYLLIALLLFTLIGPWLWPMDPARQNLDRISQAPSFGDTAVLVPPYSRWEGVTAETDKEATPKDNGILPAPRGLQVVGQPTTQAVRLRWEPVPGAAGYVIYRSKQRPTDPTQLGLPLGETFSGTQVSYEDRLQLNATTYYYSVVATDGFMESEQYSLLAVEVAQAITLADARAQGLIDKDETAEPGDTIRLAWHPLGTDYLGRDMLARLMAGAQVSLFIGIVAPLLFVLIGTLYGGLAGYLGGTIDGVLMRFVDFVIALPFLLFMILFKIAFGIGPGESGILPMLVALVLLSWPGTARLVRGQVLQIRQEPYIQASRLLGAGMPYLVWRHMLPNVLGIILVNLTFSIPSAIFTEAFLSFIGMGVVPPTPSWGSMCNEGMKTMLSHPHELIFPATLISLTVLAFNLLGDGLRDALDVRLRGGT